MRGIHSREAQTSWAVLSEAFAPDGSSKVPIPADLPARCRRLAGDNFFLLFCSYFPSIPYFIPYKMLFLSGEKYASAQTASPCGFTQPSTTGHSKPTLEPYY